MNWLVTHLAICLAALIFTAGTPARGQRADMSAGTLVYSANDPSTAKQTLQLKDSDGRNYIVSFAPPLLDIHDHVVGIDVVLHHSNHVDSGKNLLEPSGHWHGNQPFFFAGWDLEGGMHHSIYGTQRLLPIRNSNKHVCVSINNAQVDQDSRYNDDFSFDLKTLSLTISMEQRAGFCKNADSSSISKQLQ